MVLVALSRWEVGKFAHPHKKLCLHVVPSPSRVASLLNDFVTSSQLLSLVTIQVASDCDKGFCILPLSVLDSLGSPGTDKMAIEVCWSGIESVDR